MYSSNFYVTANTTDCMSSKSSASRPLYMHVVNILAEKFDYSNIGKKCREEDFLKKFYIDLFKKF